MSASSHPPERIAHTFRRLEGEGRAALVTYLCAGDPSFALSQRLFTALKESGADILEVGMPFSDPMADGPTIQQASARALRHGQTMIQTLALVRSLREQFPSAPIVVMGYVNPVLRMGPERFFDAAADAGVDGAIIVDLPWEERDLLLPFMKSRAIALIPLLAPTTPMDRARQLLEEADGFVYVVSVMGVTGTNKAHTDTLRVRLEQIRSLSSLPVVTGFGIRTPQDARAIASTCHGVVVGSALIDTVTHHWNKNEGETVILEALRQQVGGFSRALADVPAPPLPAQN